MSPDSPNKTQIEANKLLVRRALERISRGDVAGFADALVPDYVRHCQAMPPDMQEIRGRDGMHAWLLANQATFPDYSEELEWLVAEGDFVAWRSRGRGTMQGSMGPFPPTGRTMEIVIIGMHRIADGKIAETWTSWDNVAALTQLGLLPTGQPA